MNEHTNNSIALVCPMCHGPLTAESVCVGCDLRYETQRGVAKLVAADPQVTPALIEESGVTDEDLAQQVSNSYAAMKRDRTYHRGQLDKWLPTEGTIAEVGCGTALASGFYRSVKRRFVGFDLDARMLAAVRSAYSDVTVAIADAFRLPLRDQSVDGYVGLGIFELDGVRGQRAAKEAARVLKPGGTLYITVPYRNVWRRRSNAAEWRGIQIPAFSKEEMTSLLTANGFDVELLRESRLSAALGPFARAAGLFPTLLAAETDTSAQYRVLGPVLRPFANSLLAVARKR